MVKVNKFFFCVILSKIGVYKSNVLECNIKFKMLENSRLHYLQVDSSKFDKASIFRTTGIENVDAIITDKFLSKKCLDKLKDRSTEVITPKNNEESYKV
jgi:DeoR/GlpR family transcriptional regulator of sugar metabolism